MGITDPELLAVQDPAEDAVRRPGLDPPAARSTPSTAEPAGAHQQAESLMVRCSLPHDVAAKATGGMKWDSAID